MSHTKSPNLPPQSTARPRRRMSAPLMFAGAAALAAAASLSACGSVGHNGSSQAAQHKVSTVAPTTSAAASTVDQSGSATSGSLQTTAPQTPATTVAPAPATTVPPTTTAPVQTATCSATALRASGLQSTQTIRSYACSGDWAYAFVDENPPGWEVTLLFQAQGGQWHGVNRSVPCSTHEVPANIWQNGCDTN